jgi:spermidine synthase
MSNSIGGRGGRAGRSARSLPQAVALLGALVLLAWLWTQGRQVVVFEGESAYGRVRVMERSDGLRALYMGEGRVRQSAIIPGRPLHLELPYTRVAAVGLALIPAGGRLLYVGLGGGAMPMYARRILPEARIQVVEIDPLIVDVAQRHFGFRPDGSMTVHTADGRAFIAEAPPESWDLIVLDAFSDNEIPRELATRTFLEEVRAGLAPGGVVVANIPSSNEAAGDMLATYAAVFPEVHRIQVPGREQWIVVAGPAGRRLDRPALVAASRALAARRVLGFDLPELVEEGYEEEPLPEGGVLEDP